VRYHARRRKGEGVGSARPSSFGELLRRYRTVARLTQEELAERAGLSARGVQDLERGLRRSPHPDTTRRLAEALGLSEAELLGAADRAASSGGAAVASPPTRVLPTPLTSFVGRQTELVELRRLLSSTRLLTLTGTGGVGKTRLALALARTVAEDFAHGAVFVDLAPVADPRQVPIAIAYALGLREAGRKSLRETLREYLQDKHLLLVLDNFEHLLEAGPTVADLLSTSDQLKIVVTSRSVLRVYGEQDLPVPPLELPPPGEALDFERLALCSAVELFVERVRAIEPSFALTPENAHVVEALCRRLDGLPLALELAAARIRLLPLEALFARLEHRLPVLVGGARNLPQRHQTLRGAIDWSYSLLGRGEQALFRRLGVFVGGFTLGAASSVCMRDALGELDILELMGGLVDASLVLQQPGVGGEPRFRLLETLREYALELLAHTGELEPVNRAHAAYYATFAERAEREQWSQEQRLVWDRLTEEHDNLRSAIRWCVQTGEAELGLLMVGALHPFWHLCGHIGEGRALAQEVLSLPGVAQASTARGNALFTAGNLARLQGDFAEAHNRWTEQLEIGNALADRRLVASARVSLGILALDVDDLASSREHTELSLRLCVELGDRLGEAFSLHFLGEIANRERDWATAHRFLEGALAIHRELGDPWGIAHERWGLGYLGLAQGDYAAARAAFEEGLAIERELDRKQGVAHNLLGLGWTALEQAHFAAAERLFMQAIGYELEVGRPPKIAEGLEGLAAVASGQDQPERALRLLGAADAAWDGMGHRSALVERVRLDRWLATARRLLGEAAAAAAWTAGRAMSLREAVTFAQAQPGRAESSA
jgi:predicted ATPase/DNA-binding XRE family transcriptional regulator